MTTSEFGQVDKAAPTIEELLQAILAEQKQQTVLMHALVELQAEAVAILAEGDEDEEGRPQYLDGTSD